MERARVCKPCMPGLKTRIEERSAENPRLEAQAKSEVAVLEKAMEIELVDEGEYLSPSEWREAALEMRPASGAAAAGSLGEDACSVCQKAYGVFRKKKSCDQCEKHVCAACSHDLKMPSLGWAEQRRICDPCLPIIAAQLGRVTETSSQVQKDRNSVMHFLHESDLRRSKLETASDDGNATGDARKSGSSRPPKVAPLVLPGSDSTVADTKDKSETAGAAREGSVNPVVSLLSPRYNGPTQQQNPLCPARSFDWNDVCGKDLSKESSRAANKRKLAEVAKMREKLLAAQKKYSLQLATLENAEMKAKAEYDRNFLTIKLMEVMSNEPVTRGNGAFFFLSVDGLVAESYAWRSPFQIPYRAGPFEVQLLDVEKTLVGTLEVDLSSLLPEELENGASLTLPYGAGSKAVLWIRRG